MSKKLLSLVLAMAMVMSIFAIGFSTVAAADETETETDEGTYVDLTYYVLAPDDSTPVIWWWGLPENQDPPLNAWEVCGWDDKADHFAMKAEPTVGGHVYSYNLTNQCVEYLFCNFAEGKQTANINARGYKPATSEDEDDERATCDYATASVNEFGRSLDLTNFGNMIFVIEGENGEGQYTGSWYSLDPEAENYYRNSDAYKALGLNEDAQEAEIEYDSSIVTGKKSVPIEVEGVSGTFFFKPDGEIFPLDGKYNFWIWDGNGMHATKTGWQESADWGSYKSLGGTKVEQEDGTILWESFEFTIDPNVPTFAIVHCNGTDIQTCDCVITVDAFGKTMVATGGTIENMEDSSKQANEARFEGTDKCGPAKGITSTCKVVGQVLDENADVNEMVATKVNRYLGDPNWTYENVQKAINDMGATPEAVWDAYEDLFGDNATADELKAAKDVILGTDEEESEDTASEDEAEESDDQGDKTESEDQGDKTESEDQGDKTESEDQGDKTESDDQGDKKDTEDTADQGDKDTDSDDKKDTDSDDKKDTDSDDKKDTDSDDKKDTDSDDKKDTDPDKPDDGKKKKGLLGDVNEDGAVDATDALLILRKSLEFNDTINEALGDIDGDKKLTSNDALAVLRWTVDLKDSANEKVGTEVEYTVA